MPTKLHAMAVSSIEAGWLLVVVSVPLVMNPWGLNYELPKVALLRLLTLWMLAAHFLTTAWANPPPQLHRWLHQPLIRPILLLAGATILSTFTSIAPFTSLLGSYHRQQGAYLSLIFIVWGLLIATHLRTPTQRWRLMTAVAATGSLVAITPFVEAIVWHQNPFTWRPGGTLGNPIFLGGYLIMVIPFTLAGFGLVRSIQRWAWGIALCLQLMALLVTQSRGPLVGLFVGLPLFALFLLWKTRWHSALIGLAAIPLLLGGLVAGLNFGLSPSSNLSQLPYVRRIVLPQDWHNSTIGVRLALWQAATKVISTWPEVGLEPDLWPRLRPLMGYGPDTAAIVYTAVYPPELRYIEDPAAIWDRAHNETLDILVMEGWLGFAAHLLLAVACIRHGVFLWRAAANTTERTGVAIPFVVLAAHLAEIQFAFSVTTTSVMAWLCVGWLAASSAETVEVEDKTAVNNRQMQRWRVYAVVGAFLLMLAALRLEGGAALADMLASQAQIAGQDGQWKESIQLYDRALALWPWQAVYYQFRAEGFYSLAYVLPAEQTDLRRELLTAAERSLTHAQQKEPLELEYYRNSGILHAYWGDTVDPGHLENAIAFYQQAIHLAPTRIELRAELGQLYACHGRDEEALTQYRLALTIDPQFTPPAHCSSK